MSPPSFGLAGRTALVTGAAGAIGAAIAQAMEAAGARGVRADTVAGPGVMPCDVTDERQVRSVFDAAGRVDILVCAAGITRAEDVFQASLDSFDAVLRVNVTGTFLCAKRAMEGFRERGTGGRIILLGSVVGHQGALKGHLGYAASKGAVHAMAKTLARTGAPLGVTVNAVAPGVVETAMSAAAHGRFGIDALAAQMPMGRLQQVEDIAAACVFLASEAGGSITGAVLDVNGGMLMR